MTRHWPTPMAVSPAVAEGEASRMTSAGTKANRMGKSTTPVLASRVPAGCTRGHSLPGQTGDLRSSRPADRVSAFWQRLGPFAATGQSLPANHVPALHHEPHAPQRADLPRRVPVDGD